MWQTSHYVTAVVANTYMFGRHFHNSLAAVVADTYMSGRHICHMTAVVTYSG